MLSLPQLREIQDHMAHLPRLVDKFEQRDHCFQEDGAAWLRALECVLESHKLPQASQISLLRADIALADAPNPRDANGNGIRRVTRRRRRETATALALRTAGSVVNETLRPSVDLVAEGERIARQIAAVAKVKGALPQPGAEWAAAMAAWDRLCTDSDLVGATTHLAGLVGRHNAVLMFLLAAGEV